LIPAIVREAERVMVARAVEVDLRDGEFELAFVREPKILPLRLLKPRLRRLFVKMRLQRHRYEAARLEKNVMQTDLQAAAFARTLRRVQEFERTGNIYYLRPKPLLWLFDGLMNHARERPTEEAVALTEEGESALAECADVLEN
jgi:hypothetical protein